MMEAKINTDLIDIILDLDGGINAWYPLKDLAMVRLVDLSNRHHHHLVWWTLWPYRPN